jgi:hypothetical chaperone protein
MTATADAAFAAGTLGIDFGTSNSAAGVMLDGAPHLVALEPGARTIPTAVFFDTRGVRPRIGAAANAALLEGEEGRYMRALKSVLGTPLMRENRRILRRNTTFIEIIADFLAETKARAEHALGRRFDRALSGRPVHFHSIDPGRDAQALLDLTECYRMAGFEDVRFMHEPEAAAIAAQRAGGNGGGHGGPNGSATGGPNGGANCGPSGDRRGLGLIVDIGGGTSDFSVFAVDPGAAHGIDIIASHGVRVGGTDFDRALSVDHVMPLLGKGSLIRFEMGAGSLPAPVDLFQTLASWEKIPFLYTAQTRRDVERLRRLAAEPEKIARLARVIDIELGHEIAFAVERGKIDANGDAGGAIALGTLERGLAAPLARAGLARSLAPHAARIADGARETLALAGVGPAKIERVIFVGGSSLMEVVRDEMRAMFPCAQFTQSEAFTAVVDGLAIASARPWT